MGKGGATWSEMRFPWIAKAASGRPESVRRGFEPPRHEQAYPSPADWRDEIIYFLLVDRFSDGLEGSRPQFDRQKLSTYRQPLPGAEQWDWSKWADSGSDRWQGGTLKGVTSKLAYLKELGVTTIWLSPIFKQRGHLDTYHGYGVQDFLEVDPRFGSRSDLIELVDMAHKQDMRVILDIIFNHSGCNWLYPGGAFKAPYLPEDRHPFGAWRDKAGNPTSSIVSPDDGVWPRELQSPGCYTRAGCGSLGHCDEADLRNAHAEHKRTDFEDLRDFDLDAPGTLADLTQCYKFWIAATDIDGYRIDTLKHVTLEQARNFCGAIHEFAANNGKLNFLLLGEVAGGDLAQDLYLDALARNLSAALDIGEMRQILNRVAKGLEHPARFFAGFDYSSAAMPSHRALGNQHVSIVTDHDHVWGEKARFSSEAASDHQVAAATALQFFSLGIPCVYYGEEQALGGPEPQERPWLPDWKTHDRYLRETMFGPAHPRAPGMNGVAGVQDPNLPGFGPYGTADCHCFNPEHPAYRRIKALAKTRRQFPALRHGRQYPRQTALPGRPFAIQGPGELMAWSRILDDEECLCVLNTHGLDARSADVIVDSQLHPPGVSFIVALNTAQAGNPVGYVGPHSQGSPVIVRRGAGGEHFVELHDVPPSECIVLSRHPGEASSGAVR